MTAPNIEDVSGIPACLLASVDVTACPSGYLEQSIVLDTARSGSRDSAATDTVTVKPFSGPLRTPSVVVYIVCILSLKLLLYTCSCCSF